MKSLKGLTDRELMTELVDTLQGIRDELAFIKESVNRLQTGNTTDAVGKWEVRRPVRAKRLKNIWEM